jgi:hypothetical protein
MAARLVQRLAGPHTQYFVQVGFELFCCREELKNLGRRERRPRIRDAQARLWCEYPSQVLKQLRARVFRIQLGQFAQEFFRLFVSGHGDGDFDFHDFVSTGAFFGG